MFVILTALRRTRRPTDQAWRRLCRALLGWTAESPSDSSCLLLSAAHLQIGADEWLQVTIDYAVDVADFHLGAMVFD
jgi:hypothetical protein